MKISQSFPEILPVVAIPARNEEKRLPSLLAGLAAQTWLLHNRRQLPIVVVLNNCHDASVRIIGECGARFPNLLVKAIDVEFEEAQAHVGSARRLAMETAYAACGTPSRSAIMTTDADSVPAADWVENNLRHIENGVDLVGGLIIGDPAEEEQLGPEFRHRAALYSRYAQVVDRLASLIDPLAYDPWPRHRDHTGASLAVRADVYRDIGGMPLLPLREDLEFVSRARARGYRLSHPLDVRVSVSARLAGRARGGMADTLKVWMRDVSAGLPVLVQEPSGVRNRLLRRRLLRDLEGASRQERTAAALSLGLAAEVFDGEDGTPLPSALLIERFAPDDPDAPATAPIEAAIAAVERMIEDAEEKAYAA